MTAQPERHTPSEYLNYDRTNIHKHEYLGGIIIAMAGASAAHNIITANIIATLHTQVSERDWIVFPSDLRVKAFQQMAYTYPDVTVVCGGAVYEDEQQDVLLNPTIIIEVLSPSTEHYDRGKKSHYYRSIPSLREYLIVAQDVCYIEHFVRYTDYQWLLSEIDQPTATIHLQSIQCTVSVADIYKKVALQPFFPG